MFSFKLFSKLSALLLCLLLPLLASSVAVAAPFTVTYTDTQGPGSDSPPFNVGETITITIVMDNGGTSTASQTWTSADVTSITFSLNNGAITSVLSAAALGSNTGDFVTDAAGALTSVPSSWTDNSPDIISTNDPNTINAFYINGGNRVYYTIAGAAGMTNVANNIIAANWTNPAAAMAPATAVPTLSQWAMILLIMLLMTVGLLKTRRH